MGLSAAEAVTIARQRTNEKTARDRMNVSLHVIDEFFLPKLHFIFDHNWASVWIISNRHGRSLIGLDDDEIAKIRPAHLMRSFRKIYPRLEIGVKALKKREGE
jgi:hypothetical protein